MTPFPQALADEIAAILAQDPHFIARCAGEAARRQGGEAKARLEPSESALIECAVWHERYCAEHAATEQAQSRHLFWAKACREADGQ